MKKRLLALLLLLLPLITGCATAPRQPLAEKVQTSLTDAAGLMPFPPEELEMAADIAPEDCEEAVYLVSEDGLSARCVIAVRAKDEAGAQNAAEKLEQYRQRRIRETRDYLPEEYALLDAARVERRGRTAALLVGEHAREDAERLLRGE